MKVVYEEILKERNRQDKKWGQQNQYPMELLAILGEEVGEVNKSALEAHFSGYSRTGNWNDYRKELIQVAAVVLAMIEAYDRGKERK